MFSNQIEKSYAQIGVGKLGSVIIRSLLNSNTLSAENCTLIVRRPEQLQQLKEEFSINVETSIEHGAQNAETILLAMRPQQAAEVLRSLAPVIRERREKPVVISVAAGISDNTISNALGGDIDVACVLPNLLLGGSYSAVGLYASATKAAERSRELFEPIARVFQVERLDQLDTVSAISASLPGQLSMILRGIVLGAVHQGLTEEMAREIVLLASAGTSAHLLETKQSLSEFGNKVCTPAGTTIQGVKALVEGATDATLMRMVEVTTKRAREFRELYQGIEGTLPPLPKNN